MAKPALHSVNVFDAEQDKSFTFSWRGNTAKTCTLNIYESSTDLLVYSEIQEIVDKNYSCLLPANSLFNGITYYASLTVIDINNDVSTVSNIITFKCYGKPETYLEIANSIDNSSTTDNYRIVESTTVEIELSELFDKYSIVNYDSMKTIKFYLYQSDSNFKTRNLLIESEEIFYETDEDRNFKFVGLDNDSYYIIGACCTTTNGYKIDVAEVPFFIYYNQVNYGGKCYVQSNRLKGYVRFSTNFVIIQGGDGYQFDENGLINLSTRMEKSSLTYNEGFNISDDLYICIRTRMCEGVVFRAENDNGDIIEITVFSYKMTFPYKAMLKVIQNGHTYVIFSDEFIPTADMTLYDIQAYRKNNLYEIQLVPYVDTVESEGDET